MPQADINDLQSIWFTNQVFFVQGVLYLYGQALDADSNGTIGPCAYKDFTIRMIDITETNIGVIDKLRVMVSWFWQSNDVEFSILRRGVSSRRM